jgi:hypothetical protein
MSSGPDPTTGMGDPTTGMVDPTTGMVDPTTGLVDPTTGAVDPTTGAVDPTTGAVDPTTGAVDTTAGGSTGGMPPGGSGGGCAVVLDEDTFETLDTSRWFVLEDGTNDVFIDADELVTFVDSGGGNRAFVRTNATYDLSDFAATIEVTDIPTDLTYADIRLELVDEMWSWVALKTAWGGLQARGSSGNFAVLSPYDPDAFRFWRIRTLDGTIFFEVSADGEIWELVEERANPLMGQVWVVLRMQRAGNSAPGEVRMDNFLLGQGCE